MGSGGKDKEPRQKKKPGRVPTSCKECRRLKLRCDRNVRRRPLNQRPRSLARNAFREVADRYVQMASVLTPGRGGRLYLADTEELYERIEQISMRNKDLENALRRLQETVSDQPHPLLSAQDGVLQLNIIPQSSSSSGPSTSSSSKSPSASRISPAIHHPPPEPMELDISLDEDSNVIDAFGTLAMSKRGEYAFYGKTALPEYLAQAANKPHRLPRPSLPRLTKRIMETSFPESDLLHNQSLLSEVLNLLPPHDEALHLCEVYLEYGKFLYSPVSRKELFDETLSVIYRAKQFGAFEHYSTLSLLFIVFAIAALFSPNKQPYAVEALEYYYLSKTAMGFTQPFQDTSLTSIQVHVHMAQFLDLSDLEPGGLEAAWMYTGNAMRLGMKIGLHMNSSRWKLLPQEASQRRHALFWRLFVSDTWTSLHHGRPPGISRGHFDCPIPSYPNPTTTTGASPRFDSSETDPPDFHEWNVGFTLLLHSVLEASFGPKQPVYSVILDFDRKIRDFYVPSQWRIPSEEDSVAPPPEVAMYRWLVLSAKEIVLLNLHRAYFAQALQDSSLSADLQRHPYLPSVVSIFRSSWRLIRGLAMTWMVIPKFLARVNLAWSHGVSAAIVMCLFVTRAPTLHLTAAALEELDNLTSLFDSSSSSCRPAAKFLTSIQALCRKAHESIGLPHGHGRFHHHQHDDELSVSLPELDRLNGKTSYLYPEHTHTHTHTSSAFEPASSVTSGTNTDPRSRATSVTISDIAESHHPIASSSSTSSYHRHHQHQNASMGQEHHLHPTIIQDLREFALGSSAMISSSSSGSSSGSGSRPHMSFSDYPSDLIVHSELVTTPNSSHSIPGSTPPPSSQPPREREQRDRDRADTPPDTARLLQPTFSPGPQSHPSHPFHHSTPSTSSSSSSAYLSSSYFGSGGGGPSTTASYPHLYPQEPYMTAGMDPRKLMMFAPGPPQQPTPQPQFPPSHLALAMHVQSGFTGGYGASPIALDSSWNSFVEQLGF